MWKELIRKLFTRARRTIKKKQNIRLMTSIIKYKHVSLEQFGDSYGGYRLLPNLFSEKPVVLSFGIGENLSFSEDIINRVEGVMLYAFDPTPKSIAYVQIHKLANNKNFSFYPYGLSIQSGTERLYLPRNDEYISGSTHRLVNVSDRYEEVQMKSFSDIISELKISRLDVLKMDIEGSEFDVMDDVLSSQVFIGQG